MALKDLYRKDDTKPY